MKHKKKTLNIHAQSRTGLRVVVRWDINYAVELIISSLDDFWMIFMLMLVRVKSLADHVTTLTAGLVDSRLKVHNLFKRQMLSSCTVGIQRF